VGGNPLVFYEGPSVVKTPDWLSEVRDLALRVAARHGATLFGLDVSGDGRRTVVRVSVEREGGLSVEDCARISEELSRALDLHDPIPHAYTLEVATPGLDRPLRSADDFVRFAGRKIELISREPIEGRRRWRGRLSGLDGTDVVLAIEGGTARLPLDAVASARLVVEMEDLREDFARGGRTPS
jgi:ribosome maturation factor RimP